MRVGAQLNVTDQRQMTRHPINYSVIAEHRVQGDMPMHISNISANGFMIDNTNDIARGDRVIIPLPEIGRIEAYCMWLHDNRAEFQFERIIRIDDFIILLDTIQPNPRLRKSR